MSRPSRSRRGRFSKWQASSKSKIRKQAREGKRLALENLEQRLQLSASPILPNSLSLTDQIGSDAAIASLSVALPPLQGDFNNNGVVDAADYTV